MAKIDLHHAYRSVPIHPHNYHGTGLKWKFKDNKVKFTYFVDTRLPFGGRRSPEIFHRLTQAVKRIMSRKGYNAIVVYLDDFLIIGESREACQVAFHALLALLQNLGFSISWRKVVPSTQRLVFLGIFWIQLSVPWHYLHTSSMPCIVICWSFLCTAGLPSDNCRYWLVNSTGRVA